MLKMKHMCCWMVIMLLTACGINNTKDEGSLFYAVPVGSTLILNHDITIRGNQVAIFVQNGELMQYREVDFYSPNCKFEIYAMSDQPRTVNQDSFGIIKVIDEIDTAEIKRSTYLAALDAGMTLSYFDASFVFNYATVMYLQSEQQTDVFRIACQHWEDIVDDDHLTVTQMRQAMGDVFTLEIKERE